MHTRRVLNTRVEFHQRKGFYFHWKLDVGIKSVTLLNLTYTVGTGAVDYAFYTHKRYSLCKISQVFLPLKKS